MTKPIGSRAQDVQVLCRVCDIPEYVSIKPNEEYRVVINSWIAGGGEGQVVLKNNILDRQRTGKIPPPPNDSHLKVIDLIIMISIHVVQ